MPPFFLLQLRKKELLNIVLNHSGSKRGGYALEVPTNSSQVRGVPFDPYGRFRYALIACLTYMYV
jgi:hypothetical protein